jgi:hypothetical protein
LLSAATSRETQAGVVTLNGCPPHTFAIRDFFKLQRSPLATSSSLRRETGEVSYVRSGDAGIPQNVNFAIKSSVVLTFFESNNLSATEESSSIKQEPPDIARAAKDFSVKVQCAAGAGAAPVNAVTKTSHHLAARTCGIDGTKYLPHPAIASRQLTPSV